MGPKNLVGIQPQGQRLYHSVAVTDRQTERQTDRQGNFFCLIFYEWGDGKFQTLANFYHFTSWSLLCSLHSWVISILQARDIGQKLNQFLVKAGVYGSKLFRISCGIWFLGELKIRSTENSINWGSTESDEMPLIDEFDNLGDPDFSLTHSRGLYYNSNTIVIYDIGVVIFTLQILA